ncbi:MAG: hypothetical protein U0768_22315 [Anaerolineae bacterium]
MPPLPPCETTGLINLCAPAFVFNWPSWFYLQLPNAIWFGLVLLLLILGILLPFPTKAIDTTGYDVPKGE